MRIVPLLLLGLAAAVHAWAAEPTLVHSGEGGAPTVEGNVVHLLYGGEREANSLTLPASGERLAEWVEVEASVRFDAGGEGYGLLLMDADVVGRTGPVPPIDQWEEPNRASAIGIGFDSRNPPSDDAFDAQGNFYDRPQRELSIHADGREILNRQCADFATGEFVPIWVRVRFVAGGARLSATVAGQVIYDDVLLPGVRPFVPRVALGARAGGKVKLDVKDLAVKVGPDLAGNFEPPKRVVLFDKTHISLATTREPNAIVDFTSLPPKVGRVIATLRLDAPPAGMDKLDRRGALYLYTPDQQRFEVMRFRTPFHKEWQWQADVTDFLPLMRDQGKFGLLIDTWRDGFLASVTLDFYPGEPERTPLAVVNLWQGEPIIGDVKMPAAAFFDEKTVLVPPAARSAKLRIVATGHGQYPNSKNAAEFLAVTRKVSVNDSSFVDQLWQTDNYLNPCRPQKGTWKYDRAGWGPGRIVEPWSVELTPLLARRRELTLRYELTDGYVNEHVGKGDPPTHWIDSQVIFYADSAAPAAVGVPPASGAR